MIHILGTTGDYPALLATWLLPLIGALILWGLGPLLRDKGAWVGTLFTGAAFCCALASIPAGLYHAPTGALGAHEALTSWYTGMDLGLLLDPLSLLWTLVITGVGFLIHLYAVGYLHGDRAIARFFAYLNFFVFSMLTLVLSDNFIGLLIGWGLVGLASFFLIGFWFERPSAVAASRKAFVMNVVGDIGIMVAIFVMLARIGNIGYGEVFAQVPQLSSQTVLWICLGLFVGCMAKSAQVPLHTWLPDAMEGPTPVSALIHAATMVTAGVYLIARCAPLWSASPDAQAIVGVIGAITALTGAVLGMGQWDIKRVLAYSTMSQIGYMIMGVGVGAYQAGVFHFLTHAFFKAMLFLAAGIVIHTLANEQDIRRMGGLARRAPLAAAAMLIGTLAICGIPPFSGFFSKDAILYGTLEHGHPYLFGIGVVTAALTAYYMFRMLFIVFTGTYRGEIDPSDLGIRHPELTGTTLGLSSASLPHGVSAQVSNADGHGHAAEHHDHAPAWIMGLPVALLMIPSTLIGLLGWHWQGTLTPWAAYWQDLFPSFEPLVEPPFSEADVSIIVLVLVLIGIATAYLRYATRTAHRDAPQRLRLESIHMPALITFAFYFDAMYGTIVQCAQYLGRLFNSLVEHIIIDGTIHEITVATRWLGHLFRSLQTGLVRAYALILVVGVAICAAWYSFAVGALAR